MKKTNPAGLCVHVCVFETLCNTPLRTSVCVCVCVSQKQEVIVSSSCIRCFSTLSPYKVVKANAQHKHPETTGSSQPLRSLL